MENNHEGTRINTNPLIGAWWNRMARMWSGMAGEKTLRSRYRVRIVRYHAVFLKTTEYAEYAEVGRSWLLQVLGREMLTLMGESSCARKYFWRENRESKDLGRELKMDTCRWMIGNPVRTKRRRRWGRVVGPTDDTDDTERG